MQARASGKTRKDNPCNGSRGTDAAAPAGQREPVRALLKLSDAIDVVRGDGTRGKSLSPEEMEFDLSPDHSNVLALHNQLQVWVKGCHAHPLLMPSVLRPQYPRFPTCPPRSPQRTLR
jgi:hypothetical protein